MDRHYSCRARVAPHLEAPLPDAFCMGFSKGFLDAARHYADQRLEGYEVVPGGARLGPNLVRFDAINHADQTGAAVYVRWLA